MEFDPRAFDGTAEHYAAGRPPYSASLAEALAGELGLGGGETLVDMGCGPGVLELALAGNFARVVAVDPEPGMLREGRRRCREAGIGNVEWLEGVAEELAGLGADGCDVVTFGQSFHRVKRREVAEAVFDVLAPGGSLVLVSHQVNGRPRPADPGHPPIPHDEIRELVIAHLGEGTRRYLENWNAGQPARFEDTLRLTRFGGSRTTYAPGRADLIRDVDAVVSDCFSKSWSAPRLFGERRGAFETELRSLLRRHSPDGLFWDWPGDTEMVIATKPARDVLAMPKFRVRLPEAMETSMIMLYGLAVDARSAPSVLGDRVAAAGFDRVDYDVRRLRSPMVSEKSMRVKVTARAKFFDNWAREFLAAHDEATVLQLGAGLDTRVWRIDPGPGARWFDVDQSGVIEARERIFPPRDNYELISASVTDPQWLEEVPADRPVLVIAQGVTMYLDPEAGRAMFRRIAERFGGGTIVLDTHNAFGVRSVNRILKRQFGHAMLRWGIEDERELLEAVPGLRCTDVVSSLAPELLDDLPPRLVPPGSRLMCRVVQHIRPVRTMSQYLRYEFGPR